VSVSLDQARAIADAALAAGRAQGFQPLTVAVLDPGGHLVALAREDGSGILRPQIATGKAWGALGMGFGTRELAARAERMPSFVASLSAVSDGRIVPVPGGVLIRDPAGAVLGAVGISGDTSDNDETCAVTAIQATGLTPDTGA
jgi:uncharacterized protein GlcG (DUF336 family)